MISNTRDEHAEMGVAGFSLEFSASLQVFVPFLGTTSAMQARATGMYACVCCIDLCAMYSRVLYSNISVVWIITIYDKQ